MANTRYFYIVFDIKTKLSATGVGSIWRIQRDGKFPSSRSLQENYKKENPEIDSLVILSITEMKEQDFLDLFDKTLDDIK